MNDYSSIPSHMHEATRLYVEEGQRPGEFLQAIFANDFMETVGRADGVNAGFLGAWARFIYNEVPSNCHGSREIVEKWIGHEGLKRFRNRKLEGEHHDGN